MLDSTTICHHHNGNLASQASAKVGCQIAYCVKKGEWNNCGAATVAIACTW